MTVDEAIQKNLRVLDQACAELRRIAKDRMRTGRAGDVGICFRVNERKDIGDGVVVFGRINEINHPVCRGDD